MTEYSAIVAKGIVKDFGHKRALDGASIKFERGKVHVLLGRNGSGKTTLAKILAGALTADSGEVTVQGADQPADSSEFRRGVGFLFDSAPHWEDLTGWENAWFFARSYGLGPTVASARLKSLFAKLALTDVSGDRVSTYSFGMKRKLALVQALAHEPSLLVLDEPSIGLDHASRAALYDIVRARASNGASVVIATNDMNEARHVADVVSLIDEGRVLVSGVPEDLIKQLGKGVVVEAQLDVPVKLEDVTSLPGVRATIDDDSGSPKLRVMAASGDEQRILTNLLSFLETRNVRVSKVEIRRAELGDVFMSHAGVERDEAR